MKPSTERLPGRTAVPEIVRSARHLRGGHRRNGRPAVFVCLATVAALACSPAPQVDPEVALTIDGETVAYDVFDSYLRLELGSEDLALDDTVKARLFDRFIDEQLLIRLAIERGLVPPRGQTPDQRQALAFLVRDFRRGGATDVEVQAYYEAHRADFERGEEARLRQILAYELEVANQALAALEEGGDFVEVAARFSQGPRAHLGGDQGRLSQDDLPPDFVDAIEGLAPGDFSPVVSADYGFHIFQVVERFPAEILPVEAVADEIREILARQEFDTLVESFFAEARERYNVTVVTDNLPFNYRGSYHDDPQQPSS